MSKRFYLTKVMWSDEDGYIPKVRQYGVAFGWAMPSDPDPNSPTFGQPLHTHELCLVGTADHTPLENDPEIDAFPDFPIDGKWSSISDARRAQLIADLQNRGWSVDGIDNIDGYKDVIEWIGQQRVPGFTITTFTCTE